MRSFVLPLAAAVLLASNVAFADDAPPPVAPAAPAPAPAAPAPAANAPPAAEGEDGAPPAQTGFQLGIRTGVQIPLGKTDDAGGTNNMSDFFSPQVPIHLDLGGKPIPNLFIGAYLITAFGGAAGATSDLCSKGNLSCTSLNARLGVEVQYHISPGEKMNPWVGYGIGYELAQVKGSANGNDFTASISGPEYANLSAGLDFRLSKTIGIGPVVGFSLGQYNHVKTEVNGNTQSEGDVQKSALHQWLSIGARLVIFP